MKKLNLLYVFFIGLLIFLSCTSDDSNEVELSIIGGWTVSESILNGEDVPNLSVVRLLTANNRTDFIYLIDTGEDIESQSVLGNWSMDGNILTIDFDNADGTNIYTVTELTSLSMKWESEVSGGTLKEILIR